MQNLREQLIAARQGESDAWEAIVRGYQDMAVAYAYALLGDWQEAEDAAQEAFITAFYALIKLRNPDAFPGWLRRILHSRAGRRIRQDEPALLSLDQVPEIAAEHAAPSEFSETLSAAIDALPESQRTALLLHYMNDYRQAEIADFLQIPLGTVKSRLYHARQKLKQRMEIMNDLGHKRPSRDDRFTAKVMRLFDAAKLGDIDDVRRLLAEDSALANAEGPLRTSLWASDAKALHVAVMHGRKDIVDLLLAHGADIHARDEKYRFNALIHAIDLADFMPHYAELDMVSFLLQRGAIKDVWACAWLGDRAGVQAWLDQDPSLINAVGPGPSTLLSFCRDLNWIEFYLERGADPLLAYPRYGKTRSSCPLRDHAYRRNYPGVRRFLAHLGWRVDIFWACVMGDTNAAKARIEADGDLVQSRTPADHVLGAGLSPLHLAAQGGHLDLMRWLLQAQADVNARDDRGYTPLHFVVCYGPKAFVDPLPDLSQAAENVGVYKLLLDAPALLLEHGADLAARETEKGMTPLDLAQSDFEDETDRSALIGLLQAGTG